jgi:hypothetical protein
LLKIKLADEIKIKRYEYNDVLEEENSDQE